MSTTAVSKALSDPPVFWRTLHLLLAREPGRLRNTLIQVASVAVVVVIWEIFRIPNAATACYVSMYVSRGERTSTIATAAAIIVIGTSSILLAILVTMVGLSEPPVRICFIAILTFGAMFMSRAATAGTAFFASGFLVVYGLTLSDSVQQLGLLPYTISNTTSGSLPTGLFLPPEEALLRTLLWLILAVLIPGTAVILLNKIFGRDPAEMLRHAIAERLAACAAFCKGNPGSRDRLETLTRRGSPELLDLTTLAQKDHGPDAEPKAANDRAVRAISRLQLAYLAVDEIYGVERPSWLQEAGRRCAALQDGRPMPEGDVSSTDWIEVEIDCALRELSAARTEAIPKSSDQPKPGFWAVDAFSAENVQFGLKVSLSVMICYTLNNALDWQGIGTSVVTCFFVALGSLGETGHKMTLRITGCLIGAMLAIASIILLMPIMTDLVDLVVLIGAITFVAGWVACGNQRIAYAGWQIGLAFYTVVLQGFGPVTDMESAKNRIIGILLGNFVTYFVMATIWPVRVRRRILAKLAEALLALKDLLSDGKDPAKARESFSRAIVGAQRLLLDGLYEAAPPGKAQVSDELIEGLQALILPVSIIAAGSAHKSKQALASWFAMMAGPVREDRLQAGMLVLPSAGSDDEVAWLLLKRYLNAVLRQSRLSEREAS